MKRSGWLVVLGGVAVLAIGFALVRYGRGGHSRPQGPVTDAERIRQSVERDHAILGESHPAEADLYGALVRLAQRKESGAREAALHHAGDPAPLVRAGAANALGYFTDPEATTALKKLLTDADPMVRQQAITGLGNASSPERMTMIHEVIDSQDTRPEDAVAAWSSVLTASQDGAAKDSAVDALVRIAKEAKPGSPVADTAALRVVAFAPRDPRVIGMLRGMLEKGADPAVAPVAIRHLAGMRDESMNKLFPKLIEADDPQIRMAVLQSMRFACAPARYTLYDRVIRHDRDRMVIGAAIRELQLMPSEDSLNLLQKAVDDKALDTQSEEYRSARNAIIEIKRRVGNPGADPCAAPAHG